MTGPAGQCENCQVGKYKSDSGSDVCTDCPTLSTSSEGKASCECEAGYTLVSRRKKSFIVIDISTMSMWFDRERERERESKL